MKSISNILYGINIGLFVANIILSVLSKDIGEACGWGCALMWLISSMSKD